MGLGSKENAARSLRFGLWTVFLIALFSSQIFALVRFAIHDSDASHIVLVPFISAWLMYLEREKIFARLSTDLPFGIFLLLVGVGLSIWTFHSSPGWSMRDRSAGNALAVVILWIAGFALFFGRTALRASRFAVLFLFLGVPLPDFLLNRIILALQAGSAALTALLFDLVGQPYLREGFVFRLPLLAIKVAAECSGIRSSIALLILALLISHFSYRPFWKKAVFVAAGFAIMIVKNGVRIASLTLLAIYVNPDFLYGNLHHRGGVLFFLIGLALLVPVFWLLRRGEDSLQSDATSLTKPKTEALSD